MNWEKVQEISETHPPLIETLAKDCLSLDQLLYRLECFLSHTRLGGRTPQASAVEVGPWEERVTSYLGRVCQRSTKFRRDGYLDRHGVYYHEHSRPSGQVVSRVVIPANMENVSMLIMRHFHRKNHHRGRRFDVANMFETPFFLERVNSMASRVIANCLLCAKKNATRRQVAVTPVQTIPRDINLPPFSRISIDFLHLKSLTFLSALCLDTGVLFLSLVDRPSASGAIQAITRISRLYCVQIQRVLSDNAQALSKQFRRLAQEEWPGIKFYHTAPYAIHQNPVERSHREVWSVLRARKFTKAVQQDIENVTNEDLEEISWIVNRRPLGVKTDGAVITPALLAWGASHGRTNERLKEVRKYFYEEIFLLFRRRHLPSRGLRRASVSIGEIVLFQHGQKESKAE